VRKAQRDYADALTTVATAEKQADLAKEGLGLVEASYRAGATSSLDVTEARQTYIAAGFNLATSQFKDQLALLQLLTALGEELPSNIYETEEVNSN
jgi:outer membrane protein TolC